MAERQSKGERDLALQGFVDAVTSSGTSVKELLLTTQGVIDLFAQAPVEELEEHLVILKPALLEADPRRAALVTRVVSRLVERGADASLASDAVLDQLARILDRALAFWKACVQTVNDVDAGAISAAVLALVAKAHPEEAAAMDALDDFWDGCVKVLSADAAARHQARDLLPLVAQLEDVHEGAHWIARLLQVLVDEPLLIVEPASLKGYVATSSGIADNFQLQTLMAKELVGDPNEGWLEGEQPPQRVVRVATGEGPQEVATPSVGQWNLFSYRAIRPDQALPEPADQGGRENWIWGEDTPANIPLFDGRRVILLGPLAAPRTWKSQRTFKLLPAKLEVGEKLPRDEVTRWLERMVESLRGGKFR